MAMRHFKRILIIAGGASVLLIGIAMIVLPGPAFIMIPAGLAILAIELAWARRWLRSVRAIMPRSKPENPSAQKITIKSVCRSLKFLLRRIARSLHIKRRSVCC
jgi:hypothetical protein